MTTTRPVRRDDVALLLDLQHRHQPVVLDDDGAALGCALVFHDGDTDEALRRARTTCARPAPPAAPPSSSGSFAHMREPGRSAVLPHVDTGNPTGATRLYEGVGMRPAVVIDGWRRTAAT